MPFILYAVYRSTRRALEADQGRSEASDVPLRRLVLDEFPLLTRRIGRVKVLTVAVIALVVLIGAEIALGEATPGPFLSPRWRLVVAVAGTALIVLAWTIIHAIRRVGWVPISEWRQNR